MSLPRPPEPTLASPPLSPVLADARLSRVREAATERDWLAAARLFAEAEGALVPDPRSPAERCAWAYARARLLAAAGQSREAALAFDLARGGVVATGAACPLAPYAAFHAAEAYLKIGDVLAAVDRARAVDADVSVKDDADLVLAGALAAAGRGGDAIPLWRAVMGKSPRSWIDVALPLAAALLDESPDKGNARAFEALGLATRVTVEAPKIAESSGAEALRQRALTRLATDARGSARLSFAERAQQAKGWLDAGDAGKAASVAGALLREPAAQELTPAACSAAVTRAQALGRMKGGAGDAWDDAIARCDHDPSLATALYAAAKAAAGKQPDLARARYAKLEERCHEHRLADDARFQGALLALGQGDEASFVRMMLTLPDDYPEGDMGTEALFRVALLRMARGDWDGAVAPLDRIAQIAPSDYHWATAGRAEYFRARAARQTGHAADARARYAKVVDRFPLAYYMTQAYARLSEDDPALATRSLAGAVARDETTVLSASPHPETRTAAWTRARSLLEVGDVDAARREFVLAGATRDDTDPEVHWAAAALYDQAGAPEVGHAIARQKLHDYLRHYPAGAWKPRWEIAYPRAFRALVEGASARSRIPTSLAWAIMREESDFVSEARSGSNAIGLMQIIPSTARSVARGTGLPFDDVSLREPHVSVELGTRLLGQLRGSFSSNPVLAIAAYNAGEGAVGRWLAARGDESFDVWVEEIPWEETRGYEKRVLSSEAAYAYLYDPTALDEVLRISSRARGKPSTAERAAPADASPPP